MKRPWRKVVRTEDVEREQVCAKKGLKIHDMNKWKSDTEVEKRNIQLTRLHLECGHYVDVKRTKFPLRRMKCCICQSQRIGILTDEIKEQILATQVAD